MGLSVGTFIAGLAGVLLAGWSFLSSCLEMHGLSLLKLNGAKKLTALSNVARDMLMLMAQGIVMHVGVVSIIAQDEHITPYLMPWAVASSLLSLNLIVDRMRRIRVEWLYQEGAAHMHRRDTDPPPGILAPPTEGR